MTLLHYQKYRVSFFLVSERCFKWHRRRQGCGMVRHAAPIISVYIYILTSCWKISEIYLHLFACWNADFGSNRTLITFITVKTMSYSKLIIVQYLNFRCLFKVRLLQNISRHQHQILRRTHIKYYAAPISKSFLFYAPDW